MFEINHGYFFDLILKFPVNNLLQIVGGLFDLAVITIDKHLNLYNRWSSLIDDAAFGWLIWLPYSPDEHFRSIDRHC